MFSTEVVMGILGVLAFLLGCAWFVVLRNGKFKLTGFLIFGGLAFACYSALLSHVYVLDDEVQGRYSEKIALFSTDFTLKNGETASIQPQFGHIIIVNNNAQKHTYGVVYYSASSSSSRRPTSQWLQPYSVTKVTSRVDYIYKEPPSTIRIKGSSASRGWIK